MFECFSVFIIHRESERESKYRNSFIEYVNSCKCQLYHLTHFLTESTNEFSHLYIINLMTQHCYTYILYVHKYVHMYIYNTSIQYYPVAGFCGRCFCCLFLTSFVVYLFVKYCLVAQESWPNQNYVTDLSNLIQFVNYYYFLVWSFILYFFFFYWFLLAEFFCILVFRCCY